MAKTAFAAAFEKVGIDKAGMTLHMQVVTFAKTGGTEDRAIEIVRQAFASLAGQRLNAAAQKSNEDAAGHQTGASDSSAAFARPSSPNRGSGGQPRSAKDGRVGIASTVREPTEGQRKAMAKAAAKTAEVINITILDTYRIRDGRAIGDVYMRECEALRSENSREAAIWRQVQRHAVVNPDAKVRDVINPDQMNRILQRAAEVADAG